MAVLEPQSYVGLDTITRQIERRLLRRGFQFNLMVVGQSGLGKSTLLNTMFAARVATSNGRRSPNEPVARTPEIKATQHELVENEVRVALTVIDTPGFGDQVNNEKCWEPLVKYIKDQHSLYLRKELTAQREAHFNDSRVHCVLYFLEPTGHGLKPLDVIVLRKLCEVANVVPVIAKADSMTLEERDAFKRRLQDEFHANRLHFYPYEQGEYDEQDLQYNAMVRAMIPFAVIGSEDYETRDGRQVPVRRSRYGVINIEDTVNCEFTHLRSFLISTHLQDLIETTSLVHYESFRSRQLLALKESSGPKKNHV